MTETDTDIMAITIDGMSTEDWVNDQAVKGMQEYVAKKQIQGKNILFIHTGGTPLFFDFLKEQL